MQFILCVLSVQLEDFDKTKVQAKKLSSKPNRRISNLINLQNSIAITVGFANKIKVQPPEGVTVEVPEPTVVLVKGADKQMVGQFAADVRAVRPPEPYKGKGIRYDYEIVRRKEGKAFGSGA